MTAALWKGHQIEWRNRSTWSPQITEWITPRLVADTATIRDAAKADDEAGRYDYRKCLDTLLDHQADDVVEDLSLAIRSARMRLFHATRVENANCYHVHGLVPYPRSRLLKQAEHIVAGSPLLRPLLPYVTSKRYVERSRDKGVTFTCIDDRPLIEDNTHYAMYGSEWIIAHLINLTANVDVGVSQIDVYDALRDYGVPTILIIDLPLRYLDDYERRILVRDELLPEWVGEFLLGWTDTSEGQGCPIVRRKIPAKHVVDHYHPRILKDAFNNLIPRSGWAATCAHCLPTT